LLASSGKVDLLTLQKLLTHGSPQMTQRYAHLHDEALKKASSVIDELVKE
jgi:site-specific recombinase XerD